MESADKDIDDQMTRNAERAVNRVRELGVKPACVKCDSAIDPSINVSEETWDEDGASVFIDMLHDCSECGTTTHIAWAGVLFQRTEA